MEVKLVVVAGEAPAAEYPVQLPATIGRSRMADVKVGHPLVSRKHCELFAADDGMLMIRDMGSLNGTFVGDARIGQPTPLPPGAVLTVGAVTFQAVYGDMPPAETTELQASSQVDLEATANASAVEPTLELGEHESPITEPAPEAAGDGGFNFNWLEDPAEQAEGDAEEPAAELQFSDEPPQAEIEAAVDEQPVEVAADTPSGADTDSLDLTFPDAEEPVGVANEDAANEFAPPEEPAETASDEEDDDLSDFLASLK
jgi:pSer/pThr/pTyr-binding forkhead associated (FHA) protein